LKVGAAQIAVFERCPEQICVGKIRLAKNRAVKISIGQLGRGKIAFTGGIALE
jgi:hypothetical protein